MRPFLWTQIQVKRRYSIWSAHDGEETKMKSQRDEIEDEKTYGVTNRGSWQNIQSKSRSSFTSRVQKLICGKMGAGAPGAHCRTSIVSSLLLPSLPYLLYLSPLCVQSGLFLDGDAGVFMRPCLDGGFARTMRERRERESVCITYIFVFFSILSIR